nr:hypothetical protein [Oleiphilaceae bacterium]
LLTDNRVMAKIWNQVDFSKQAQVGVKKTIKALQDDINAKAGNSEKILASVADDIIQAVSAIDFISGILASLARISHDRINKNG